LPCQGEDKCANDSECQGEKICHNGSCVEVSYLNNLGRVCSKNSDGTGKGSNGNEYDIHKGQDVNYQWCMDKCSKDKDRTGIEHRWSPETDQQCEILHTKIKSLLDAPGSSCDKKVYSSTSVEEPVYVSYKEEDGVCRSIADGTGQGSKGNEYDLYLGLERLYLSCKNKCSEDSKCVGFEQRYVPVDNQQCEIWYTDIKSTLYKVNSKFNRST
jgi:hypothetical protein